MGLPPSPDESVGQSGVRREQQAIRVDITEGRSFSRQTQKLPHEPVVRQPELKSAQLLR